jgi:hypothetical protein
MVPKIQKMENTNVEKFGLELAKLAVAQVASDVGFKSLQIGAVEALSDILLKCRSSVLETN